MVSCFFGTQGFYKDPIATLDFASLYPSIMQAYNLCYSTLVTKEEAEAMDPASVAKSPSNDYFVTRETKKGILPQARAGARTHYIYYG